MMTRSLLLLIVPMLCVLGACESPTDDGTPAPGSPTEVVMAPLANLPLLGGDVTGIAITSSDRIVALIDGKLCTMEPAGGVPSILNGDADHLAMGLDPASGALYTLSASEFRTYDIGTGARTSVPFSVPGRIESSWITFSPAGEPFITILTNYPRTFTFYSADRGKSWTQLAFNGGSAYMAYSGDIAFTQSGTLLAGDYAGLYATDDHGATWRPVNTSMPNFPVRMLGVANGDIYRYTPGVGNLAVSRDGGRSFSEITSPQSFFIAALRQGPDGALYALAATSTAGATLNDRPMQFARSADGGASWQFLVFGTGHDFALRGPMIALGLATHGYTTRELGGILISADRGARWTPAGLEPAKQTQDFALDRSGNLLILADQGLYRRTPSGWQSLGSRYGFFRFAATPTGRLLLSSVTDAIYSNDDGASWRPTAFDNYLYPGIGTIAQPVILGRRNGEFLCSITTYRDDLGTHTAGALYRLGVDGTMKKLSPGPHNFVAMVEDAHGLLYGSTVNFSDFLRSLDGGESWQTEATTTSALAFNSANKAFTIGTVGTRGNAFLFGDPASGTMTELTLSGFTSLPQYITSARFGPDDRLYILTRDEGLFISQSPLK